MSIVRQRITADPGGVHRGLYGPQPKALLPSGWLLRARIGLKLLAYGVSLPGIARAVLRPLREEERSAVMTGCAPAAFPALMPCRTISGFRLVGCQVSPGPGDVVDLAFEDGRGRAFTLSQRRRWLPLAQELALSGVGFTSLRRHGTVLYLVHGSYGGEPIDHSFWADTRRGLVCERDDVILEFREIVGRGPGLARLLLVAWAVAAHRQKAPPGASQS
jgi:hypothetical protein